MASEKPWFTASTPSRSSSTRPTPKTPSTGPSKNLLKTSLLQGKKMSDPMDIDEQPQNPILEADDAPPLPYLGTIMEIESRASSADIAMTSADDSEFETKTYPCQVGKRTFDEMLMGRAPVPTKFRQYRIPHGLQPSSTLREEGYSSDDDSGYGSHMGLDPACPSCHQAVCSAKMCPSCLASQCAASFAKCARRGCDIVCCDWCLQSMELGRELGGLTYRVCEAHFGEHPGEEEGRAIARLVEATMRGEDRAGLRS